MSLSAGDTFLLPRKLEWKDHLFIILLDADKDGNTVIVNFTSAKPHSDRTTVLQPCDHSFIIRETVVNYLDATITKILKIEQAIFARRREVLIQLEALINRKEIDQASFIFPFFSRY